MTNKREELKLIAGLCFILGLAIALPAQQGYLVLPPAMNLLAPVVIPILIIAATWQILRRSPLPYLHPAILVGGYFVLTFGMGAMLLYNFDHLPFEVHPEYQEHFSGVSEDLPNVSLYALVGILGVICGATIWPARTRVCPKATHNENSGIMRNIRIAYYWALPFFAGASFARILFDVPTALAYYLTAAADLAAFGFLFAGFEISRLGLLRSKWLVFIVCETVTILSTAMRNGERGEVLWPFVIFCIGIIIQRRRIPKKLAAVSLGLALLVMPFLNSIKSGIAAGLDFDQSVQAASRGMHEQTIRSAAEELVFTIADRVTFYPKHLAIYSNLWPSTYPFERGQTLIWAIKGLVPRFIDPNKEDQLEKFNNLPRQAGILAADDYHTSSAPDAFSDYYLNFGVLGIFFLSILHGLYFNVLYRFLVVRSKDLFRTALYAYLTLVIFPDISVFRRVSGDSRYLLLWGAFYLFAVRLGNNKKRRPALPCSVNEIQGYANTAARV